jgi:hypothetical protein
MARTYQDHFCIAIVAQGSWRPKDATKVKEHALAEFYSHADQSKCDACCSCPVCRALWDLFDPLKPGQYDRPCEACEELVPILKKARGAGDGLTLFSHSMFPSDTLKAVARGLLQSPKVKKVLLLELGSIKVGPKGPEVGKRIDTRKLKGSEFLELMDKGADRFEQGTLYEVVKDSYYSPK